MKKFIRYLVYMLKILLRFSALIIWFLYFSIQFGDSSEPTTFQEIMEDRKSAIWFWSTIVGGMGFLFAWFNYGVGLIVIFCTLLIVIFFVHPLVGLFNFLFVALPCLIFVFLDSRLSVLKGKVRYE